MEKDKLNYQPISVLPVVAKVFEALVHHQLYLYLSDNSILTEEQAGFRANRSTQDVLLRVTDEWRKAVDAGMTVAAAFFLDLYRAFDSVNHDLMKVNKSPMGCTKF